MPRRGFTITRDPWSRQECFPVLQVLFSDRAADEGVNADPLDSGYFRCILSPGLEVDFDHIKLYADTEFPVFQYFNGNQLVAPVLVKVLVAYAY